ncbi:MAG: DMT family transporter [Myxococcota bacterium]
MTRLALLGAVVCVSTAAIFIRMASAAPPLVVGAWRVGLAALVLAAISRGALARSVRALTPRALAAIAVSGLLLALHFGVWIQSLYVTSLANSVVIVATQPLWAALLAPPMLGERPSGRALAGAAVAMAGCALLGGLRAPGGGDWLALAGAVTAAAHLTVGRSLRHALPLLPYLALVNFVAAVTLATAAWIAGAPLLGAPRDTWIWLVLLALVPSLGGHTLLNFAARRVPAYLVSLAILGEPVGAILLGWALLGDAPPIRAVAGGAIVLCGVAWGLGGQSARREAAVLRPS